LQFIIVEPEGIRDLLCCWTGWPFLPEGSLRVNGIDEGAFKIYACFLQIDIPINITREDFERNMNMAIRFGSSGFGSV